MPKKKIETIEKPINPTAMPTAEPDHVPHETQRARIGAGYLVCPTCGEEIPNE